MPPLQLMGAGQVKEVLRGMERRGEIPHDWETTWPWAKQVSIAHSLVGEQLGQYTAQLGRAQEWPLLGEQYGGPLAGGAEEWYAREPGQAPTPLRTLGQITGWVGTPEGLRVGTTPAKALKRSRLAVQEYGLPVDRPAVTSWLRPPGGMPERGAVVQTAFMHGLPPGAGAVSPAFPEIGQPYTRLVPITPGAQITAVARPGAYATRGGALELLRTTTGIARQPVKDWERVALTGQPTVVPYSVEGRPEITEAYRFPMMRYTPSQAGTVSMKAFGVKAFMGPGYDPQAMGLPGAEQILPWPKDIRQQYAGLLGTPYGRAWTQEHLGLPIPAGGVEWGTELDPQLMAAGRAFVEAHTQMRTVQFPVHEQLLGTRRGGMWAERTGPYWGQMPRGAMPGPMGGGRYMVQQRIPVLQAPFLSQYRREHVGAPFISGEELGQLAYFQPQRAQALWREGAGARQPYMEMFRAIAATRRGGFPATPIENLPWGRIQERARGMMEEELSWVPEGQRVPGQYLARAAAEIAPGPMAVQYGRQRLVLPGPGTFERLGQPGPLGEEVTPLMGAWHRLAERAAMAIGPGGLQTGQAGEMRAAVRQTWMAMQRFARGAGVQREIMGTRPQRAWEGPVLAHTGLAAGEEIWGPEALSRATGARGAELEALQRAIAAGGGRGIATGGWRRPISDPFGQVGGQGARIMTEEMAREAGLAVSGLGRGIMVSPYAMFEQRGDVDADRILRFMQEKIKWVGQQPVLGALQPGLERGLGTIRRIAGALRLHSPAETPEGTAMEQIWGSTAKWNEARAWLEEIQGTGRMEQVMEWYGGGGGAATWQELAGGVQRGLEAKEMMGRTYNRFIRELRPEMTQTAAGRRAFRQLAAGPYQRTIDVSQLSKGARTFLEMQEAVSMIPKGGGYGFAKVFSPYERVEEEAIVGGKAVAPGELRPQMMKFRGWGDIGVTLTGAIMGMEEVPMEARAYGIGGERFHRQVLEAMRAGREPGEILGLMGRTEREAMAAAGPMMQSTMQRLYSKMPEGEQKYIDYQGRERTVQMPLWSEAPPEARAIRERGFQKRRALKVFSRRTGLPPKQLEQAIAGGMALTPEQEQVMGWVGAEMGLGAAPVAAAPQVQEAQAQVAAATSPYGDVGFVRQWRGEQVPQAPSDAGLRRAIAAGGGGVAGPPPPPAPPGAPTVPPGGGGGFEGYMPGYRRVQHVVSGPSGQTFQTYVEGPFRARREDVEGLRGIQTGIGRSGAMVEESARRLVESFSAVNKAVEEGTTLRKEEIDKIKAVSKQFDDWRKVGEEWQRQWERTTGMAGSQEFEALRAQVGGALQPMMGQVGLARGLQKEMQARLPMVAGAEGPPPAGIGARVGGWLAGRAPAGRGFWARTGPLAYGLISAERVWRYTGGRLQQWMGEYAGYAQAAQQAQFALGGQPQVGGPMQDLMAYQASMANMRAGMGQAAWQNWGWLYGLAGQQGTEPGLGQRALTMGLGAVTPYAMLSMAGGIAGQMGMPAAAGLLGGVLAPAAGVAGAAGGGAWAGGEISNVLARTQAYQQLAGNLGIAGQYQPVQGIGDVLGRLTQFGREGLFLGARGIAGATGFWGAGEEFRQAETRALRFLGYSEGLPRVGGAGAQRMAGENLGAEEIARQLDLPTMPEAQRLQLLGRMGAVTGQGVEAFQPGSRMFQMLEQFGERAPAMGFQNAGQYYAAAESMAAQMGAMPGTGRMAGIMGQVAQLDPTQFLQAQTAAPVMGQIYQMTGLGMPVQQFSQMWSGLTGPQQRRFGALMGGNQMLWSMVARTRVGQALGVPETVAPSGLAWGTEQLWGIQDQMTAAQRAQRDAALGRRREQFEWAGQYQGGMFDIQDTARAAQRAHQQRLFGFQQAAFDVGQRQWEESFALGRRIFEARVGWQAEDVSRQQERRETQWGWRFEDLARSEAQYDVTSGWRREDLQRSIRYSTGRQRIEAQRQLQRFNVQASWQEEEFDIRRERLEQQRAWEEEEFETAKQRNEELVQLQREQFEMRKRHHDEDAKLQAERFKETVAYYEEQQKLEDERIALERENWEKQREWQKEALDEQEAYNEMVDKLLEQQKEITREQQKRAAEFQKFLMFMDERLKKMDDYLKGGDSGNLVAQLEGAIGRYLGRILSLVK